MVPRKWGLERSTDRESSERLGWNSRIGEVDCGDDHVAGLVERIAHTMLEDDDEIQQSATWGGPVLVPPAQSAAETFTSWDKRRLGDMSISGYPQPIQKKTESEAMELLYTELVRLKMDELAAAQQQLALYQNASFDAGKASHVGFSPTVPNTSNMPSSSVFLKHQSRSIGFNKLLHAQLGETDWSAPSIRQGQTNGMSSGQRLGAPLMHPSGRYLMCLPASRESGGTGVFLPRCRAGARSSRAHDSKRKPEFQYQPPVFAGHPGSYLSRKAKETVVDRTSLQYPSCSSLQEVAPDISLPTEWTY